MALDISRQDQPSEILPSEAVEGRMNASPGQSLQSPSASLQGDVKKDSVLTQAIVWRRERMRIVAAGGAKNAGLAFSGGGVRAASAARGFLDTLSANSLVHSFAYMSSVSGGGYTAAEFASQGSLRACPGSVPPVPDFSRLGALFAMTCEIIFRLLLPIGVAYLVYFFFPSILGNGQLRDHADGIWLAAVVLVFGCLAALTVEAETKLFKQVHTLSFVIFIVLSLVTGFHGIGLVVAALGSVVTFVILVKIFKGIPHRKPKFASFKNWPKLVIFSVLVFALLGAVPIAISETSREISFGILGFIAAVVILHHEWYASLDVVAGVREPVFSYYRHHLAACFLKKDMPLSDLPKEITPFPIFNATADNGAGQYPFEMTPIAVGSATEGYVETCDLTRVLTLADVMAVSGGAVDVVHHDWDLRTLWSLFFSGTGLWLAQGSKKPSAYESVVAGVQVISNFPSRSFIRLSDGGFSDNLGVLALLQRRSGLIVCLDAAYDPEFMFSDLRKLCNYAALRNIAKIDTKGLPEFAHGLRFASPGNRFVQLSIVYPGSDTAGTLILVKLADHGHSASKSLYSGFPQITTNDQFLTGEERADLYGIGQALANEVMPAMTALLRAQPAIVA